VLLPDGTGYIKDIINDDDISWRVEDNVLHVWNEGGYFLGVCHSVALAVSNNNSQNCSTLTIGNVPYYQEMPNDETDPTAYIAARISKLKGKWWRGHIHSGDIPEGFDRNESEFTE